MNSRGDQRRRPLDANQRDPTIEERKERFERLNQFVQARGGWVTSVPGAPDPLRFEALPGSPLPDQLIALGYDVVKTGESQRILPHAIRQKFTVRADGALEPVTEGSSKPVSVQVTNAGIATVEQFDLRMLSNFSLLCQSA